MFCKKTLVESKESLTVSTQSIRRIDNLVFEGGGAKGFYHIGPLLVFEEYGLLQQVKRVAGSSIGSLIALVVALGYNAQEMKKIILSLDLMEFVDFSGEFIEKFTQTLIHDKLPGKKDLSFAELHELKKINVSFKDLFITGVNLCKGKLKIFSHETTPDMTVVKAVCISMALPGLFPPVYFRGDYYIDGGALLNLPIRIFDHPRFLEEGYLSPGSSNMRTLGIALSTPSRTAWERGDFKEQKRPGIFSYLSTNQIPFSGQYDRHRNSVDALRTLYLKTKICSLNMLVTSDEMREEIRCSEFVAADFIKTYYANVQDPHAIKRLSRL